MEDGMIINKNSMERGFGKGFVYKHKALTLEPSESLNFDPLAAAPPANKRGGNNTVLDVEGLPFIGQKLTKGSTVAQWKSQGGGVHKEAFKDDLDGFVETVNYCSNQGVTVAGTSKGVGDEIGVKLRFRRDPIVGDKFSSRHGQKGILTILLPQEDLPFSESLGCAPDILFNPHGFPSRMTIGMLIECLIGKSAAVNGYHEVNGTAFSGPKAIISPKKRKSKNIKSEDCFELASPYRPEDSTGPINDFAEILKNNGFSYWGVEQLYSGIEGVPLETQIFTGIIYYQRLRHMVADKGQARTTGPIDHVTRQPVKGRRRHGGIRMGEMERDAALAHGISKCLQDRLMVCSDQHSTWCCTNCGSILWPSTRSRDLSSVEQEVTNEIMGVNRRSRRYKDEATPRDGAVTCLWCRTPCTKVLIPFVLRYLANELLSMGIGLSLDLKFQSEPYGFAASSNFWVPRTLTPGGELKRPHPIPRLTWKNKEY
eukprot:GHVL01041538.1.p2 GENE.GHVL01041538.1~~GHVL01041538.1.p2  ORF type:complete len:483 (-),score=87.40 GHVL01041538.1:2764-4212(-)